jgi:hypothetical protein
MRKCMGHKLMYGHDFERLYRAFMETEQRHRRQLFEEFWRRPLEHELSFQAQSAWLQDDDGKGNGDF